MIRSERLYTNRQLLVLLTYKSASTSILLPLLIYLIIKSKALFGAKAKH
ncbi:hypothetical protein GII86_04400 [Bacillus subtilis]|nr:hypothetical protein GII86_04400 [Bacillus subtilis]